MAVIITVSFFTGQFLMFFDVIPHIHAFDLYSCFAVIASTFLMILVAKDFLQNKGEVIKELEQKNTYLEHAAKIIRHDMHSGINTYLPRGVRALERKISAKQIEELKIEAPMKMLKEGLAHTRRVYAGVYEFTNLVKKNAQMSMAEHNVRDILAEYFNSTSYKSQVILDGNLSFELELNKPLFCTAIDNLVNNGLKYNDSDHKLVKIYKHGNYVVVEDNGRGLSKEEYIELSAPYVRKEGQKENGSGLGLNISKSIFDEHGFTIRVEKIDGGVGLFYEDLNEIEKKYVERPDIYVYHRESLEEVAKENKYKGKLRIKRGGRDKTKAYVFFDENKESCRGTKIKIRFK